MFWGPQAPVLGSSGSPVPLAALWGRHGDRLLPWQRAALTAPGERAGAALLPPWSREERGLPLPAPRPQHLPSLGASPAPSGMEQGRLEGTQLGFPIPSLAGTLRLEVSGPRCSPWSSCYLPRRIWDSTVNASVSLLLFLFAPEVSEQGQQRLLS